MRLYAIGDVHGQRAKLEAAHERIEADRRVTGDRDAPVVHLGDYCDRGPDTRGVLQLLIDGQAAGHPWICLMGNHDRLMRDFLMDGRLTDGRLRAEFTWFSGPLGGSDTLASYGVHVEGMSAEEVHRAADLAVPHTHRKFLGGLPLFHETGDLFLVHAGIAPGVPFDAQVEDDLLWIRGPFLDDTRDHGKLVVHGHTPVDAPMHCGNRVALDTGAGFGRPLTVAVFEGRDCWVLTDTGRVALTPPGG